MKTVIVILAVLLIAAYVEIKKIKSKAAEEKNEYLKEIERRETSYQTTLAEKNNIYNLNIHNLNVKYTKQIEELKKEIDDVNRKLEFYKNIENDSGELNSKHEKEDYENITEEAANNLKGQRTDDEKSESSSGAGCSSLDEEQTLVWNEIESKNGNYFITGKAGTGKSFLLDVFRKATDKMHIVLAPTGIAALNVGGATIHSAFGYDNLVKLDVDKISAKTIRLNSEKRLILKKVKTIIIDEISMVRADTFEKIDRILKAINENDMPFGGKQMLLFGDLFQLPPIAKAKEQEYLLDRYKGIHFFVSDAFKQGGFAFRELTINHRQKEDAQYFELLNRVREGGMTSEDISVLNSRVVENESIYDRFTTLLPTKVAVEKLNRQRIELLDSPEYTYRAKVVFDKYPNKNRNIESIFPVNDVMTLKKGVLVMMVSNDPEHRWVNGTLGIVNILSENRISVSINKRTYDIQPMGFTEQEAIYENGKITYEDVLEVEQYPIVPAYAITIHKSQGQTYKNIVCDIDRCFADGQAYVALSRCSSLEGLHLKSKVRNADIRVDKSVLDFYRNQKCDETNPDE